MVHIGARDCDGDSTTIVGEDEYRFTIELSLAGPKSEWIYSKPNENGIVGVCVLEGADLPPVLVDSEHEFVMTPVQIFLNRWVLVKNVHDHIAAIRLTSISGNEDHTVAKVHFVYAIFLETGTTQG